jgi:predicted PurR-regulated permease PerM
MNSDKIQLIFFIILFAAIGVLAFFVFLPFMSVIAAAMIFAVVMQPLYNKVLVKIGNHKNIAAGLVVIVISFVLISLLSLIVTNVFSESKDLYSRVTSGEGDYLNTLTMAIEKPINRFLPNYSIDLRGYADGVLDFVKKYAGTVVSTTASSVFYIFLGMIAFFFFLRDGKLFRDQLVSISPLKDEIDTYIIRKMKESINTVVKGTLLIALIQGLLVGIGFVIFGVPNPTLWGSIAVICAIIPGAGTAIIALPAIVFLVLHGTTGAAIGLALWQLMLVGLIDNLLAPYLYGRGSNVHHVLILFSVLGGLAFFGPIGFLFGPLVITLLFVLLQVYRIVVLQVDSDLTDK